MGSTGVPVVDEDAASAAFDLFPVGIGDEHGDESVRFEEDELRLVSTMVNLSPSIRNSIAEDYKEGKREICR